MAPSGKPMTHQAWGWHRKGPKPHQGYWVEIGTGRENDDQTFESFMDRTPIGGFNGRVVHRLTGSGPPPPPQTKPQRPGESGGQSDEDEEA